MEEQTNEVLNEQPIATENPEVVAPSEQVELTDKPQEDVVQSDTAQPQEMPATEQPAVQNSDTQVEEAQQDKKKKKGKKKDKKSDAVTDKPEKPKKEKKVGAYVVSLFKYFNIITLLPFALLMYAIFFSSYIVDKGELFKSNLVWICVILGIAAAIMIAWFVVTFKKRRVCSFDAFLLMALMICVSMIAQCIIFKNFASFDGISIATLAATVAVLALLTVRLIMFSPSVQRNHNDKSYKAKNKLSMYFKVIFTKYGFFISMLCVIGALLILIISKSNIFEDFEFVATQTEKIVTMVFAALAAILMIVGIFIRIVRGRANVIDCMPYMMFMVTIGGLIYFITRQTYMILYIAIGCAVVGAVWLVLCQYTLLMSNYKQAEQAEGVVDAVVDTTPPPEEPIEQTQPTADTVLRAEPQPIVETAQAVDTPTTDAPPTEETPTADSTPAADTQA
ncbi:MAG: hypothetical protein K2K85_03205 [Clostridia bacterium]|nr:hypothetical protein [Clostridia bacterium]